LKERFDAQYKGLPDVQQRAATLQQDAKINSEIYLSLLKKIQELSVSKAGGVGGVHIVDAASIPTPPTSPKNVPILEGTLMLGLLAGAAVAFVRERYLRGLTRPEIVERTAHLPVLAVIPLSNRASVRALRTSRRLESTALVGDRAGQTAEGADNTNGRPHRLLALSEPFNDAVESLRGLRESVQFELADSGARTLVITSPAPYDGKSFISANLAALIAESGKRVLLVDADLRRGHLAERLGMVPDAGKLTEQLLNPAGHDACVRLTSVPNLYLLGAGEHLRNPSAVLTKERFEKLARRLSDRLRSDHRRYPAATGRTRCRRYRQRRWRDAAGGTGGRPLGGRYQSLADQAEPRARSCHGRRAEWQCALEPLQRHI
jgi:tyrosine-protein kinase Etk/Wzc